MSDALNRLVREARADLGTDAAKRVDWDRVDREIFRQVEAARTAERAARSNPGGRGLALACGALAAAAAVAFVVTKSGGVRSETGASAVVETAGTIAAVESGGTLLVDGKPVAVGTSLNEGDVIDARGAQASVEQAGKLTMVLEHGTRAKVAHVHGALVLALEEGAIEAQVVPVASGEAFAVDVGSSRVAVHGTHLRVARSGAHVVVDLVEGVVSLGEAPRVGSTLGELIVAPAHAEFSAGEPENTLDVTHDPASVRGRLLLGGAVSRPSALSGAVPAPVAPRAASFDPPASLPPVTAHPGATAPSHLVAPVDPGATSTITSAVRACLRETPHADNVTVVVNTTLRLEVGADGAVQSARFDPPVAPDVNGCASSAIYRARFGHGGSEAIPIDVTLPSSAP